MEVFVDLLRILQGHACFYLIMQDELPVLAHQWFQAGAHRRYRELSGRIQFMEQGLSWHEDRLYLSYVKTRARVQSQRQPDPLRIWSSCHAAIRRWRGIVTGPISITSSMMSMKMIGTLARLEEDSITK